MKAADRIQDVMTAPFKLSDLEIKVECAIGLAMMQPGQDAEELFRNAQFAVKQAKAAGCPQVYHAEEASQARRRFSIETELRRALERDELKLFYQPLINLQIGQGQRVRGAGPLDPRRSRRNLARPNSSRWRRKAG